MKLSIAVSALLFLSAVSPASSAQSEKPNPSIKGIVTCNCSVLPSQTRIPGVTITAIRTDTKSEKDGVKPQPIRVGTDEMGTYTVGALPPGTYLLTSALAGFKTQSFNVEVKTETTIEQNVTLRVSVANVPPCNIEKGPCL